MFEASQKLLILRRCYLYELQLCDRCELRYLLFDGRPPYNNEVYRLGQIILHWSVANFLKLAMTKRKPEFLANMVEQRLKLRILAWYVD